MIREQLERFGIRLAYDPFLDTPPLSLPTADRYRGHRRISRSRQFRLGRHSFAPIKNSCDMGC